MPQVVVLGAGMVGSLIASDLASAEGYAVSVLDASERSLERVKRRSGDRVQVRKEDLSSASSVRSAVADADVVVGALASHLGFNALGAVIDAGKPYADISFMPEDAIDLTGAAKARGVAAIVDCGVAPGMSNLLAGEAVRRLDRCDRIDIYVGGLPVERRWPFEYKAGFAPADVIEEYTRPSRIVEHGEMVVREALSEPERMDFPGVGTLEAFNTDGLRSIATTLNVPFMREKTLRYEGHIELMRVLRAIGLFGTDPIDVKGVSVRPRDVLSTLMFPMWTYEEGEADLTVMRVSGEGELDGRTVRISWDMLDHMNPETFDTSMSRTTAFPCAIAARLLAEGKIEHTGVLPLELLASGGLVEHMFREHAARGVTYSEKIESI
jgi:saccharopine dehydrogenase-like NADP-dependent oxidoreductase